MKVTKFDSDAMQNRIFKSKNWILIECEQDCKKWRKFRRTLSPLCIGNNARRREGEHNKLEFIHGDLVCLDTSIHEEISCLCWLRVQVNWIESLNDVSSVNSNYFGKSKLWQDKKMSMPNKGRLNRQFSHKTMEKERESNLLEINNHIADGVSELNAFDTT